MKKSSVKAKGGQNKTNSLGDLISLLRRLKVFRPFFTTSTKNTLTGRRSNYIKSQTAFRVLGTIAISSLVLLFATVIAPIYNTANSAEAITGTATESTLTFTSTNATASVNLAVNDTAGTFATSTEAQKAAFSIATDNYTGYTLTIKSSSCTTSVNCKLGDTFPSITSRTTSADFAVNTWGYIPSYYNSAANTANYYPAPTTSAATLRITSGPNTTEDEYTIGLGIKADFTNPSGTYANETFVLEYVANPTAYSIAYDRGKATSDPGNMPSTQSGSVSATSITLSSAIPTLTGYTFTGWCLGEVNRSSAEVDSCTGTDAKTFAAGGTFGIDRTSTNSVTLHAMWSKATVNVTVNFAGSGVTGVTFANTTYGNITVSTSGGVAALKYGVSYTITGSYSSGYEFSSWAATAGSLGSTSSASTTYSTTTGATLTLTGKSAVSFTVNFGTGIAGVIVKDSSPEGDTVATVTTSGTSVPYISVGSKYYLLPLYNSGYTFSNMTTSGGTKTAGDYGYYYYTIASGTNTVTVSATTLGTTSSTNMQGLTDANCTPYPMAVKDARDDEVYYVQRLADGKCWMLDNLRLDLVGKKDVLSTSNTNATDTELGYLKNGGGTTSDQYATSGVISWPSSTAQSYSVPWVAVSGNTSSGGTWDVNTTVTSYGSGSGKVGAYYNYCAASAGTYCYGNGTSAGTSSGNATADICPKGWQMPSTGSSNNAAGSYYYLYNTAYSADRTNFRIALSTPLSGVLGYGGSPYSQGSYGRFWSSTRFYSSFMYFLYVDSSDVNPTEYNTRNSGYSVRCVTTPPPAMQDATSSSLATLMPNVGDTATLVDSRDGEAYLIGHLADGKYWMLDNLALDLTDSSVKSTLSSANTNASDTTLGYLKNGGGSSPYTAYAVDAATSTNYFDRPAIAKSGTCYDAYCVNGGTAGSPWSYTDSTSVTINNVTSRVQGKIGIYYNFCAASAGSYCYSSSSSSGNATEDICPAGWHLPTGSSSGQFKALYTAYKSTDDVITYNNFVDALSTPLSGGFYSGTARSQGYSGFWWSSTRGHSTGMSGLSVQSSKVYPQEGVNLRSYMYPVRCVATGS